MNLYSRVRSALDMLRILRLTLLLVVLLAGTVPFSGCTPAQDDGSDEGDKPNIILIMADDLGYGDLGAYGQKKINTPALDELAKEGTVFTQFYSGSAVCAPARSVLMTGKHTGHTAVRDNKAVYPIGNQPLPDSSVTVAEVLKEAGYRTAAMGKWGLGPPNSEGSPNNQGFDLFYGYLGQRRAHHYYPEFLFYNDRRAPLPGNKVEDDEGSPGSGPPLEKGTYSQAAIADSALTFIRRNQDRPFFLYLPFTIPHVDIAAPDESWAPYLDDEGNSIFPETPYDGSNFAYVPVEQPNAGYAAMVSRMDSDIGRIKGLVEELGLAKDTIILFTSDNGPTWIVYDLEVFDSNGVFRGHKRDLYEGGIRMPMIAWGPGRIPANRRSDAVWAMWDFFPTLAEYAGASVPNTVDGISFVPTLSGNSEAQEPHDHLYWEIYGSRPAQAIREGRWKAVRKPAFEGEIELYDLMSDPAEQHDLSGFYPTVTSRMDSLMSASRTESELFPE